jgi:hypothetical protein
MFGHIAHHYTCQTTDKEAISGLQRRGTFKICPAKTIRRVITDNYVANHSLVKGKANRYTAITVYQTLWFSI